MSVLGNVHTLNLSRYQGVIVVSALGNMRTLHLVNFHGVVDVSALGNVTLSDSI